MKEITVGVTGGSGSGCAQRLLRELVAHSEVGRINAIVSASALVVAREEIGPHDAGMAAIRRALAGESDKVRWLEETDIGASIASGSHLNDGTVIVPCSTGTLGAIATGTSRNLIHRAAEVALKERRLLLLGMRESPLSVVHIENMLTVTRAGAIVIPITPAFYSHPRTIDDVIDLYVGRLLDHLGLSHRLGRRWGS